MFRPGVALAASFIVMTIVVITMLATPQGEQNPTFHLAVIISACLCLVSAIWFSFPSKLEKVDRKRTRGQE